MRDCCFQDMHRDDWSHAWACVWQSILNKSQASRAEGRGGCHGNKEGLWLRAVQCVPVLVLLVVGAPRSGTITMAISGLTPHMVVEIKLECEIGTEAHCAQIIRCLVYRKIACIYCSLPDWASKEKDYKITNLNMVSGSRYVYILFSILRLSRYFYFCMILHDQSFCIIAAFIP